MSLVIFLVRQIWHVVFLEMGLVQDISAVKNVQLSHRNMDDQSLLKNPINGRKGSALCEGEKVLGCSSCIRMCLTISNCTNYLPSPSNAGSCTESRAAVGPMGGISVPSPLCSQGASVLALGVMQEGLLRSAGTVSVSEIAAF